MIEWIIANIRTVAIIGVVGMVLGFAGGWTVHGWRYDSAKLAALEAQVAADKLALQATNALLEDSQKKLATERLKTTSLTQRWINVRKNTADCPLPIDGLGLLREAIGQAASVP